MVPDKFNMVDMEGIDLLESQGIEIEGLYDKLVESITLCRYTVLYNWKFDGIEIPPSYLELEVENNTVFIGDYVSVTSDDIVYIHSIEIDANIVPISITENGVFSPSVGVDGYSPVTVDVEPVIESLSVSENGTYTVSSGVDGYSPVTVDVEPVIESLSITENGTYTVPSGVDGYSPITVEVGEVITPSLPYSDSTKILVSADQADYIAGASSWDGLIATNAKKFDNSVLLPYEGLLKYDLGANNTPFTLYMVARAIAPGTPASGNYYTLVNAQYSASVGNSVIVGINQNVLFTSVWGGSSEMRTSFPPYDRFVVAMSVDGTNKTVHWNVNAETNNGVFTNSGQYIRIGAADDSNGESTIVLADFVGIVSENESTSVISQNISHLMALYGISEVQ